MVRPLEAQCYLDQTQVAGLVIKYATLPSLILVALQQAPLDAAAAGIAIAAGLAGLAVTAAASW